MDYTIYIIAGGLFVAYIIFSMFTKGHSKKRKGRKFMEGNTRKDRNKEK